MEETNYIVHNEKEIKGFFGQYRFLSNFHKCPVYFDGVCYPSTENAFMAAKSTDEFVRSQFKDLEPKDAKALGRKITLRGDWEKIKYDVMSTIVFDKFYRNPELRDALLATGDAYLEETNHWNDKIWGVCNGEGDNRLGLILMNVRDFWKAANWKVRKQKQLI